MTISSRAQLPKAPTGIQGLDEITGGGLPKGRSTLVCGGAGCGKTLLAMEFLVRGATQFNEPGIFIAFEETVEDLTQNVRSLGFDLTDLVARKLMLLDYVHIDCTELEASGEYDLEGLFIRLGHAIDTIGAKRVVLDSIETLLAVLPNVVILRAELCRLFRWLKEKGVTAVIIGESGEQTITRHGLEEYVSDCVILLDHRANEQSSSRRLRVVKYRGSTHGTNEYPFLIDQDGISMLPATSLDFDHPASTERVATGILGLDAMLGGEGYLRGSSVLVSGTPGTGKTTLAAAFGAAACQRGERALFFAFEESPSQIVRNMRSVGIDLEVWVQKGLLRFQAIRPVFAGLEMQLMIMHRAVDGFKPTVVIGDPFNNLVAGGNETEVMGMLVRLVDYLKTNLITSLFTLLTSNRETLDRDAFAVSNLIDTWLSLRDIEVSGEHNRGLYVLKSRGMAHSNQVREMLLSDQGVGLRDVYIGPNGMMTGSAALAQLAQDQAAHEVRKQEVESRRLQLESGRAAMEAQIASLKAEFMALEVESRRIVLQEKAHDDQLAREREEMESSRGADGKSDRQVQL